MKAVKKEAKAVKRAVAHLNALMRWLQWEFAVRHLRRMMNFAAHPNAALISSALSRMLMRAFAVPFIMTNMDIAI